MADQIVVMRDGIVEQRGGPLELYDHPANLFVAGFIGSPAMNFIPGVARGQRIELGDGAAVDVPRGARVQDGQKVVYGTRPEHLALGGDGQGLPASVVVVEPTGADTQVFAKFAGTELTAVFRERHRFTPGDRIRLKPQLVHLFDDVTGKRLNA